MRTLSLTSPCMTGEDVKDAQRALRSAGAWAGKIDGVFGEQTARACAQAKYVLGYRSSNCKQTYGKNLNAYLTGKAKPNALMRLRASRRKNKPMLRDKALFTAQQYIGVKENPIGSNQVMFSQWYGMIGPWCAMFVTYAYTQAKAKHFDKNKARWAYCPFILDDARHQRNGLTVLPKDKVLPGDIVLFDWNDDGVADHVGITSSKVNRYGDFTTVEGNTGVGEVAACNRNMNTVIAFVRVWE